MTILLFIGIIQIGLSILIVKFGLKLADHLKESAANMELLKGAVERVLDRRGLVEVAQNWVEQEWQ